MEGFAPFCLVCCFETIQLYHKIKRISSIFYLIFSYLVAFRLWITLKLRQTETQARLTFIFQLDMLQSYKGSELHV